MTDTLKTSRFNLILVSVVLSIYYAADIKVSKFSFFGLEIVSGNSIALLIFNWLVWFYFLLRYTSYFFGDGGKDAVGEGIRKSIAYFIVKRKMNLLLSKAISGDTDLSWSSAKIAYMKHKISRNENGFLEIKYEGELSGSDTTSKVGPQDMITTGPEWSILLRIKSFFRSVYRHPEILEFIAPFFIALIPATVSLWIKGPDIFTNIVNYYF